MITPAWRSLTQALLKNGMGFSWWQNKKTRWIYLLIGLIFLPIFAGLLFLIYAVITSTYTVFAAVGQTDILLTLVVVFLIFFSLIFSLTLILNSFYFSNDIEYLLSLPLKPRTFLTSKMLVLLVYESIFGVILAAVSFLAFGQAGQLGFSYYLGAALGTLTFALTPLLTSAIIIVLLMRLTRFFRNKEFINKYSGLVAVILILLLTFAFSLLGGLSEDQIVNFFSGESNLTLLHSLSWLFPQWHFLLTGMLNSNWLYFLFYLLGTGVLVALFYLIINTLYLPGATNLSESSARRRLPTTEIITRASRQRKPFTSYLLKELKNLWRTPAYFNNCLLINFIWPLLLWIIFRGTNLYLIFEYFEWPADWQLGIILAVNLAFIFFIAGSNSIAATAVSREGKGYFVMKYLPLQYQTQLQAKLFSGLIVGSISGAVYLLLVYPLLHLEGWYWLFFLVLIPLINLLVSSIGLAIDLRQPQLAVEDEQAIVRQNFNIYLTLALSAIIGVVIIGLGFYLFLQLQIAIPLIMALITLLILVFSFFFYFISLRRGQKNLSQIEA